MKLVSRVVGLLLLALALPALAAGPIIVENPLPSFSITPAQGCGTFTVQAVPEVGKPNGGEAILFADSQIFAGPAFVTLTNMSTGKSTNLNISGPASLIFTTNGVTAVNVGLTLAINFNFNAPEPSSQPGIVLADGRLVQQFDNSGTRISVTFTGTRTNVCQLLE